MPVVHPPDARTRRVRRLSPSRLRGAYCTYPTQAPIVMGPLSATAFVAAPGGGTPPWGCCRTALRSRQPGGAAAKAARRGGRAARWRRPPLPPPALPSVVVVVAMGVRAPPPPPGSLFFDLPPAAFWGSPATAAEAAAVTRASAALGALRRDYPRLGPPARRAYLDAAEATLRRVERLLAAMAATTPADAAARVEVAALDARLAAAGTSLAGVLAAAWAAYAAMRVEVGGE